MSEPGRSPDEYTADSTRKPAVPEGGYGPADGVPPAGGTGPGWNTNASFGEGPGSTAYPSYPSPGTYPGPYEQPRYQDTGYPPPPGPPQPYGSAQQYGSSQYGVDPSAPDGRHPATGEPYGSTSRVLAGVLQVAPLVAGLPLGIGRFVMGSIAAAVTQLVLFAVSIVFTVTVIGAVIGVPLYIGVWLWVLVDGIMILVGRTRDGAGRLLKP